MTLPASRTRTGTPSIPAIEVPATSVESVGEGVIRNREPILRAVPAGDRRDPAGGTNRHADRPQIIDRYLYHRAPQPPGIAPSPTTSTVAHPVPSDAIA